jgi:hypothetical protein
VKPRVAPAAAKPKESLAKTLGIMALWVAGMAGIGALVYYVGFPLFGWYTEKVGELTKGHEGWRQFLTSGPGLFVIVMLIRGILSGLSKWNK